jgi:mannosyltransferase
MYALLGLLGVLSTAVLLRWLRAADGRGWALGYTLLVTAGLYTHYFFPAILLLHGLIVLGRLLRGAGALLFLPLPLLAQRPLLRKPLTWLGLLALAGLLYLPWLPIFLRQAGGGAAPRPPLLAFLHDSLRWLLLGETVMAGALGWVVPVALALLLSGLLAGRGRALLGLAGTAVPVLFMFAAGATAPQFQKFLVMAAPFWAIGLVSGGWRVAGRGRRAWFRAVWVVLLLTLVGATGVSLRNLYADPAFARADYRAMAARIAADAHPNAGVILNAPNQWEVFTYYHREGAPVYPLPRGWPDPAVLEPELAAIAARHDRLYAIFWGDAQRDPERLVERWLDARAFKAGETWVRDVRFVVYALPGEPVSEMATAAGVDGRGARFGDVITLRGYTLGATALRPGDIVQVTLFWETAVALDARYKVFLHLLDAEGRPAAQRDSEPGGGLALTTTWQPGVTVVDNHGVLLPIDLPPGDYPLVVGLYDFADPTRRLAVQVNGAAADRFELGMVVVR